MTIAKDNFLRSNHQIRAEQVRLIDKDGEMIGIVPIAKARFMAQKDELDLVEISSNADVSVCKIMDFNKYKYEQKKKLHDAKKNQKVTIIKEVKMRPNIGHNDLMIKVKHIKEFIEDEHKVKVALTFKGREMTHTEVGRAVFDTMLAELGDLVKAEFGPRMQGNQLVVLFISNKK